MVRLMDYEMVCKKRLGIQKVSLMVFWLVRLLESGKEL